VDEVNDVLRQEATTDRYQGVLGVAEEPLVSADIVKDPRASIVRLGVLAVPVRRQLVGCHAPRIGPWRTRKPRPEPVPCRIVRQGWSEHTMRNLAEIPILACSLDKRFFSGRASCGFEQV
jgi:hypothetical protein